MSVPSAATKPVVGEMNPTVTLPLPADDATDAPGVAGVVEPVVAPVGADEAVPVLHAAAITATTAMKTPDARLPLALVISVVTMTPPATGWSRRFGPTPHINPRPIRPRPASCPDRGLQLRR